MTDNISSHTASNLARSALALALCVLAVAPPVQAQSPAALECPRLAMTPELHRLITRDFAGESSEAESEQVVDLVVALAENCMQQHAVTEMESEGYGEYAFALISMDMARDTLAGAGINLAVLNGIFDIGPGAANARDTLFTEDRVVALLETAVAPGTDIEAVPESVWTMLGVYVAATADYYAYTESR